MNKILFPALLILMLIATSTTAVAKEDPGLPVLKPVYSIHLSPANGSCVADSECSDGLICNLDGACVEPGFSCNADSECADGYMCNLNHACVEAAQTCTADSECADGYVCTLNQTCKKAKKSHDETILRIPPMLLRSIKIEH